MRSYHSTYNDEEVGVRSREDRDVHGNSHRVGFVETNSEVALSAQQKQDEDADVHEADAGCKKRHDTVHEDTLLQLAYRFSYSFHTLIGASVVQVVQDRNQNFENVTALQNVEHEFLKKEMGIM